MSSPQGPPEQFTQLQQQLNHPFANPRYLVEALRAPGAATNTFYEQQGTEGYRNLAQLGESLIRLLIIDDGYSSRTERSEVNARITTLPQQLEHSARALNLASCIVTNASMQRSAPTTRMMTQSLQALCAAVYLDSGRNMNLVREVLTNIRLLRAHTSPAMVNESTMMS